MNASPSLPLPENPAVPIDKLLVSIFAATGFMAWFGNYLFWIHTPGISLAIYVCAAAMVVAIMHRHEWHNRTVRIAAGLLAATSCATALEISFTNVCVLIALLAVICGECWYGELAGGWARWSESMVSWLAAPARWPWLARRLHKTPLAAVAFSAETGGMASRLFMILAPALWLTVIFGVVLGFGNAVFSNLVSRMANRLTTGATSFDFSIGHMLFFLASATAALGLAHPRIAPSQPRAWTRMLPQIARPDTLVAVWQSRLALIVLNALFFTVNTIDVFYLWSRAELPAGVSFSEFVHHGVYSLIVAVMLSALVIALIFQQEPKIKNARFLKTLAMCWIAQNLVLIAGVFLRLKLYVEAYQLSEQRIYVGCFLLLVMVGFALLAWHVKRDGRLNTLIFRCMLATFALFFILQFIDVAGTVARYNVSRWKNNPAKHALDVAYLDSLGSDAWPALVEAAAANSNPDSASAQARNYLQRQSNDEQSRKENADWRSWQWRRDHLSSWLIEQSREYPPTNPDATN